MQEEDTIDTTFSSKSTKISRMISQVYNYLYIKGIPKKEIKNNIVIAESEEFKLIREEDKEYSSQNSQIEETEQKNNKFLKQENKIKQEIENSSNKINYALSIINDIIRKLLKINIGYFYQVYLMIASDIQEFLFNYQDAELEINLDLPEDYEYKEFNINFGKESMYSKLTWEIRSYYQFENDRKIEILNYVISLIKENYLWNKLEKDFFFINIMYVLFERVKQYVKRCYNEKHNENEFLYSWNSKSENTFMCMNLIMKYLDKSKDFIKLYNTIRLRNEKILASPGKDSNEDKFSNINIPNHKNKENFKIYYDKMNYESNSSSSDSYIYN